MYVVLKTKNSQHQLSSTINSPQLNNHGDAYSEKNKEYFLTEILSRIHRGVKNSKLFIRSSCLLHLSNSAFLAERPLPSIYAESKRGIDYIDLLHQLYVEYITAGVLNIGIIAVRARNQIQTT